MPPDIAATKAMLRERLRERVGALDGTTAAAAAAQVAERVLALPEVRSSGRILTCLSFGTELDTRRLVDRLLAEGRELYVPRADPRDRQLHVHPYPCPLETLSFGLRQPPRGTREVAAAAIDETIEVVLVLGLAFDRSGYRLGHGSGYFDRFLAGRPFPAIGLGYDVQLFPRLPHEPHDIAMRLVVTEAEVCRPAGAAPA